MNDKKINDGGVAFPSMAATANPGMSLRDYFAAAAMQGMLASDDSVFANFNEFVKHVGETSYRYADAMLKAREEAKQ